MSDMSQMQTGDVDNASNESLTRIWLNIICFFDSTPDPWSMA